MIDFLARSCQQSTHPWYKIILDGTISRRIGSLSFVGNRYICCRSNLTRQQLSLRSFTLPYSKWKERKALQADHQLYNLTLNSILGRCIDSCRFSGNILLSEEHRANWECNVKWNTFSRFVRPFAIFSVIRQSRGGKTNRFWRQSNHEMNLFSKSVNQPRRVELIGINKSRKAQYVWCLRRLG